MKYKIEEKDNEKAVYDTLFEQAITLIQGYPPELVASTLMAIAQRLYRTHLNDEDYKRLMDFITTVEIEPYEVMKERLH